MRILLVICRLESEADKIGLILMAAAGYDPRVAPAFYAVSHCHVSITLDEEMSLFWIRLDTSVHAGNTVGTQVSDLIGFENFES